MKVQKWPDILREAIKVDPKKIKAEHEGLLEVPAGKDVDQLPLSHFIKLAEKKGLSAIVRGLINLYRWNKNQNPKLSKWAKEMQEKLSSKFAKNESKEEITEAAYIGNLGFEEMMKLYNVLPDNELKKLEAVIKNGDENKFKAIVKKYLGIKLK